MKRISTLVSSSLNQPCFSSKSSQGLHVKSNEVISKMQFDRDTDPKKPQAYNSSHDAEVNDSELSSFHALTEAHGPTLEWMGGYGQTMDLGRGNRVILQYQLDCLCVCPLSSHRWNRHFVRRKLPAGFASRYLSASPHQCLQQLDIGGFKLYYASPRITHEK